MNSIIQLKGYGAGRRLLIIGRGPSVMDFRFDMLPKDVDTMIVNEQHLERTRHGASVIPTFMIYTDPDQAQFIDQHGLIDGIILIGFKGNPCKRLDYYFSADTVQMNGCTTVYYALQIAQIMEYREVYLIGVDLKPAANGQIRYIGDQDMNEAQKAAYLKTDFRAMDGCFDKIKWTVPIYQCNPDAALKKFPHRLPWGE